VVEIAWLCFANLTGKQFNQSNQTKQEVQSLVLAALQQTTAGGRRILRPLRQCKRLTVYIGSKSVMLLPV